MIAYKYRSGRGSKDNESKDIFERDIELLSQDMIYVPTIEQLNDPSEALHDESVFRKQLFFLKPFVSQEVVDGFEKVIQSLNNIKRDVGIYSLSKVITNELMWAYYASGHCGYAILFDTDVLSRSFENGKWGGLYELDVKYLSKLPRFDLSTMEEKFFEESLSFLVGHKSNAWKHEAEHRLVFDNGGKCIKIDYRAIKGFVFGCRMNPSDVDYVMRKFSGRNLVYYQVRLKENSYELWLEKLIDYYPEATEYYPNMVEYCIDDLLDNDKRLGGVGYKYKPLIAEALSVISREPFVTKISHVVVSDERGYPHVIIWTKIHQDGYVKKKRSFEFNYIDGVLTRV